MKTKLSLVQVQKRFFKSRFFTISVLLHFILILTFGGSVIYKEYVPDFPAPTANLAEPIAASTPPLAHPEPNVKGAQPFNITVQPAPSHELDPITTQRPTTGVLDPRITARELAPGLNSMGSMGAAKPTSLVPNPKIKLTPEQLNAIKLFTENWMGKPASGIGSNPRDRICNFTVYLAKYGDPSDPNRGGDWASTNWVDKSSDGKETIWGGSLPNLLYYMSKFSNDKIHASPQPVPLDLSSAEIFAKRPPFIFFTGHCDFVLTETEVENLRKYVTMGGCIWGDSSLPGHRSRFDVAFRREMRRVIPDVNKDWQELPADHPMFTKNLYYPEIKSPPPGINYYKEPVYALMFGGQVAVIYTANDYGDMWQLGLTDKRQFDFTRDERGRWVAMNTAISSRHDTYFRNAELAAVNNSYKFGTNLVIHLMTRWEDDLKSIPQGL